MIYVKTLLYYLQIIIIMFGFRSIIKDTEKEIFIDKIKENGILNIIEDYSKSMVFGDKLNELEELYNLKNNKHKNITNMHIWNNISSRVDLFYDFLDIYHNNINWNLFFKYNPWNNKYLKYFEKYDNITFILFCNVSRKCENKEPKKITIVNNKKAPEKIINIKLYCKSCY